MVINVAKKEYNDNKYLIDNIQDQNIKKRVDSCLKWFIVHAVRSKLMYYLFSAATIVLPILSSLFILFPMNDTARNIASSAILGVSAISAAFINLFDLKSKWSLYRNQAEQIKRCLVGYLNDKFVDEKEMLRTIEESMVKTDKKWTEKLEK